MQRELEARLLEWKEDKQRKPLILRGARQVGKTWLLKEFGKTHYNNLAYLRLEDNQPAQDLFDADLDPRRIVEGLQLLTAQKIEPQSTLIVLDEIQAAPKALTALKYFCEELPQYHIAVAGSLLGIALHDGLSFPVGKVNFLDLYPLTFREFLLALDCEQLVKLIDDRDFAMMGVLQQQFIDRLREYLYVGGMPEPILAFRQGQDFMAARKVQQEILAGYELDFSKHVPPRIAQRCRQLWRSLPFQLGRENKKFVYGVVKEGARGRDYEEAIQVLQDCGLIHKVNQVSKPGLPLASYQQDEAFKLYAVDCGLLACMSGLEQAILAEGDAAFAEFKGSLTEQLACQELIAADGFSPYYWSASNSSGEVDFICTIAGQVEPIEVKASVNLKGKSLRAFVQRYDLPHAYRFSLAGYEEQGWLTNLPLYALSCLAPQ
jgi:predicted AAA+ superfamily ATPase